MKRLPVFVIPFVAILFVSGCMFDSDDDKDAKKGSVSGKITMIVTGEPVAGVKVMLVNRNAAIDTVDYTDNRAAFVDSELTDAEGRYAISGIAPGSYGVVPVFGDSTAAYKFTPGQSAGSYAFAMNGDARTVDFITEKRSYPGADSETFKLWVTIKISPLYIIESVTYARRAFSMTMPFFKTPVECGAVSEFLIGETMGYWEDIYSEDNLFQVKVLYHSDVDFTERVKTFYVGYMLRALPLESWWTYDFATGKLVVQK